MFNHIHVLMSNKVKGTRISTVHTDNGCIQILLFFFLPDTCWRPMTFKPYYVPLILVHLCAISQIHTFIWTPSNNLSKIPAHLQNSTGHIINHNSLDTHPTTDMQCPWCMCHNKFHWKPWIREAYARFCYSNFKGKPCQHYQSWDKQGLCKYLMKFSWLNYISICCNQLKLEFTIA